MASMRSVLVLVGFCLVAGVANGKLVSQDDSNNWNYNVDSFALSGEGNDKTTSESGFDFVESPDDQTSVDQYSQDSFAQQFGDQSTGANSHQFESNTFPDDNQVIEYNGDHSASYDSLASEESFDTSSDEGGRLVGEDDSLSFAGSDFSSLDTDESTGTSFASDSSEGGKLVSTTFNLDPPAASGTSFDYRKLDDKNGPPASERVSYALGDPEEKDPASEGVSYALDDPEEKDPASTEGNADYVYDAHAEGKNKGDQGGESFSSTGAVPDATGSDTEVKGHEGPSSVYTPASNTEPFTFHDPRTPEEQRVSSVGDSSDSGSSLAVSSDTTTASTSPLFVSGQPAKGTHGCPSSFWASHREQWPRQISVPTLFKDVCGDDKNSKVAIIEKIYGTTTVFQALLDTRVDPYSQLLRQTAGALLNAFTKSEFSMRAEQVCQQFKSALSSGKVAASVQAQKFENANKAYGPNECA